jgi:hypothetical protein
MDPFSIVACMVAAQALQKVCALEAELLRRALIEEDACTPSAVAMRSPHEFGAKTAKAALAQRKVFIAALRVALFWGLPTVLCFVFALWRGFSFAGG